MSEKKKIAKNPVTAPKPPSVNPLFPMSAHSSGDVFCLGLFVGLKGRISVIGSYFGESVEQEF
jgi:hypothetical protein